MSDVGAPGGLVPESEQAWFRQGLRFACTECGRCCTGGVGYVWVQAAEIERLASRLALTADEFGRLHLRRIGHRYALLEHPVTGECTFLLENRCTVYEARPDQCRRFPWWPTLLASPAAWRSAATSCEGIHDQAPVVSQVEILKALKQTA